MSKLHVFHIPASGRSQMFKTIDKFDVSCFDGIITIVWTENDRKYRQTRSRLQLIAECPELPEMPTEMLLSLIEEI